MTKNKPEILSPAGNPEALYAAAEAGADAVYFGTEFFNARMNAGNFTEEETARAMDYCRRLGIKTYITLNTQLYGGEVYDAAKKAAHLYDMGADAFITADLGLARVLHAVYPEIEFHASTQMTGQNAESAAAFAKMGFTRMVAPRELSLRDIRALCAESPIETEIFIHGALCVSASGQCLLSSVIGGRSGNRGQCAQPCRLPYLCAKGQGYPLSLKDLCLAGHVAELTSCGVASFKIEGRMKSADYVYNVTRIYRRLLDEKRNASDEEISELARLFSRSGFTDGYFTEKINSSMLGIRTESDKRATSDGEAFIRTNSRKLPLDIKAEFFADRPPEIHGEVTRGGKKTAVSVIGSDAPKNEYPAVSTERIRENLAKLGSTLYRAENIALHGTENARFPLSAVNALRRALCDALDDALVGHRESISQRKPKPCTVEERKTSFIGSTAYFTKAESITEKARGCFSRIYVPLMQYIKLKNPSKNTGVALPPVVFPHETEEVCAAMKKAAAMGCSFALITNLWQVKEAAALGFELCGDMRLGICNGESAAAVCDMGFDRIIISSEARGIPKAKIPRGAIIYGALPVMTLEKCAIREVCGAKLPEISSCRYCDTHGFTYLCDRTGAKFPMTREFSHRNVIFNSVPVWMADKKRGMDCDFYHFIFTNESAADVDRIITKTEKGEACDGKFCRLFSPK